MERIGLLTAKRVFTLEQAAQILPVILKITRRAQREVQDLSNRIPAHKPSAASEVIQARIETLLGEWQDHIRRLGAEPKGFWNVDFDNGSGYFCWKFPEADIRYWHRYQDGFAGRIEICCEPDAESAGLNESRCRANQSDARRVHSEQR